MNADTTRTPGQILAAELDRLKFHPAVRAAGLGPMLDALRAFALTTEQTAETAAEMADDAGEVAGAAMKLTGTARMEIRKVLHGTEQLWRYKEENGLAAAPEDFQALVDQDIGERNAATLLRAGHTEQCEGVIKTLNRSREQKLCTCGRSATL